MSGPISTGRGPQQHHLDSGRPCPPTPTFKASLIPRPITRVCMPFSATSFTSAGCTPGECWMWKEKADRYFLALSLSFPNRHSCEIHSPKKCLLRFSLCQGSFMIPGLAEDTVLPRFQVSENHGRLRINVSSLGNGKGWHLHGGNI